jgi:hypothetical protein
VRQCGAFGQGDADEAGEHGPGADLDENACPGLVKVFDFRHEVDRLQQVVGQQPSHLLHVPGIGLSGCVGKNGDVAGADPDRAQRV